jgi:hypothetical protein
MTPNCVCAHTCGNATRDTQDGLHVSPSVAALAQCCHRARRQVGLFVDEGPPDETHSVAHMLPGMSWRGGIIMLAETHITP